MATDDAPILGIDLGTTYSAVAVFRDGRVETVPNALGEVLTPSVVALDERSGSLAVGRTAKDLYALEPARGAAVFKRGMGTDLAWTIAGAPYGAVDLSAMVLRSLKADAERHLGRAAPRAVVTVPAYFNESQRFATVKAGELAGLDVVRVLNEPTAAAIAHGLHRRTTNGTLLVFDLGGGTFDVCVMDRFEGALEVRSVAGESFLGGEDFTRRLASLALSRVGLALERAETADPRALGLLVKRAELVKRRLSTEASGTITVPPFAGLLAEAREVEVARGEAEEAFASLVERLLGPCRAALRGAGLSRDQVDELIVVGGATRMPCVQRFVRDLFGREPLAGVDPDLAVVHGAAIQAALLADDAAVQDLVVTDVASHSLGVEVSHEIGGRHVPGFFHPLIHRNTVIPASRSDVFSTLVPNQTVITLAVFEGESRHVKDNRRIGELKVTGIPKGPPGDAVRVTFTYDLNGILEVEAVVPATGAKFSAVFTRSSERLTDEQIAAARARMARLKKDPAEAPRIRDLIARADLLLRELPPEERRRLEEALLALEHALASRDPAGIDGAARWLEDLCRRHDHGERW